MVLKPSLQSWTHCLHWSKCWLECLRRWLRHTESNTGREVRQAVMSGGMPNPGAGEAGRGFCTAGRWLPSAPGVILGHGRSVPVACGGMGAAATFGRDANSSSEPAAGLARDITQAYPGTDTLADQSPATETSTWKWNVTSLVGQGAWVIASVRLSGTG